MSNKQQFSGSSVADTANDLSNFWADCPRGDIRNGSMRGWFHDDDFTEAPLIGTQTAQIGWNKGKVFATSGAFVVPATILNSIEYGGTNLQLLSAAANDRHGYAQAYPSFFITGNAATSNTLWMEARIALTSIANATTGLMLGLAEVDQLALAAGVPFSTNDSIAITNTASFIGFNKATTGLGVGNTAVSDRATSMTNIGASEVTFAANTFVKLGMKYDIRGGTSMITFYVNGVKTTTRYTAANIAATTNLKANPLGLILATIGGSAISTNSVHMDWWKCYQLAP